MPTNKPRIEWCPGPAARDALSIAEDLFPGQGRQAVIDRLILVGLDAYLARHWQPPQFVGRSRQRWPLPPALAAKKAPGKTGPKGQF